MSMDIRDDELDMDSCRSCGRTLGSNAKCGECRDYGALDIGCECDVCHSVRPCHLVEDSDGVEWDICDECLSNETQNRSKTMTLREALLGGPGHDGYAYQADTYCVDCGRRIIEALEWPMDDDAARDTDTCPVPIFFGENDHAVHCAECGEYMYGYTEPDFEPVELDDDWYADSAFTR